jgi:hypothetical protein
VAQTRGRDSPFRPQIRNGSKRPRQPVFGPRS